MKTIAEQAVAEFLGTLALVFIGAGSVVIGLVAARAWGLPAGGAIVLVAVACFAVASGVGALSRRGAQGVQGLEFPQLVVTELVKRNVPVASFDNESARDEFL